MSQLVRHPSGPIDMLRNGIRRPAIMMANPLPMTMKPAARPRMPPENQAATRPITGTLVAPLPMPVTM
jgi:hypothetical protein